MSTVAVMKKMKTAAMTESPGNLIRPLAVFTLSLLVWIFFLSVLSVTHCQFHSQRSW